MRNSTNENFIIEEDVVTLPQFPINSFDMFNSFVDDLAENMEMRKQFKLKVLKIGGKNIVDHLTNILTHTITNSLAMKLTWDGQRGTTGIKNSSYAIAILEAMLTKYKDATNAELAHTCSEWLRRSGDRYRYHLKVNKRETFSCADWRYDFGFGLPVGQYKLVSFVVEISVRDQCLTGLDWCADRVHLAKGLWEDTTWGVIPGPVSGYSLSHSGWGHYCVEPQPHWLVK
ncbi:hypothetical protein ABEB36_009371 [Hypothenemus hampei]|uniref:DUF4806 domain-containing protein n=1 Tax=Hypothenemus hampei TaxID=57062 RepID=A0ABD1EI88_HYPHA